MTTGRQGQALRRKADARRKEVARLESDLAYIDQEMAVASIAISLKRIADAVEGGLGGTIRGAVLRALKTNRDFPNS